MDKELSGADRDLAVAIRWALNWSDGVTDTDVLLHAQTLGAGLRQLPSPLPKASPELIAALAGAPVTIDERLRWLEGCVSDLCRWCNDLRGAADIHGVIEQLWQRKPPVESGASQRSVIRVGDHGPDINATGPVRALGEETIPESFDPNAPAEQPAHAA